MQMSLQHLYVQPCRNLIVCLLSSSKFRRPSQLHGLPTEIWTLIFERAIPQHTLFDTSLSVVTQSSWCKTLQLMKSIVLVCRTWYHIGVIFLYKYICIRRFPRLEQLRTALVGPSLQPLGQLVKSLDINCYIPDEHLSRFNAYVREVMDVCPFLTSFGYCSPCDLPPSTLQSGSLPPRITHLRLDSTVYYDRLLSILHELRGSLLVFCMHARNLQMVALVRVSLPSLQTLSVIHSYSKREVGALDMTRNWDMPALQQLTIWSNSFAHDNYPGHTITDVRIEDAIISFVSTHGQGLLHLHIGIHYFLFHATRFQLVLQHCPLLERLIIHPSTFRRIHWMVDRLFHPKLRWIDFTHYLHDKPHFPDSSLCLSKQEFPSLQGVRRFCNLPPHLVHWLDEFQPTQQDGSDNFTISIWHQELECQAGLILWKYEQDVQAADFIDYMDPALSGSFSVWDYVSSDSDYMSTSGEDSDTSSDELLSEDDFDSTRDPSSDMDY